MQKQAPTIGKLALIAVFALSCFLILTYLWTSFGGPTPISAKGYRFQADFEEATQLADNADVRISGVSVGHVKKSEQVEDKTRVEIEVDERYAPLPQDTQATLRQKTLLGETYVELTPGSKASGDLPDGGLLPATQIRPTVELDEILRALDEPTRERPAALPEGNGARVRGAWRGRERGRRQPRAVRRGRGRPRPGARLAAARRPAARIRQRPGVRVARAPAGRALGPRARAGHPARGDRPAQRRADRDRAHPADDAARAAPDARRGRGRVARGAAARPGPAPRGPGARADAFRRAAARARAARAVPRRRPRDHRLGGRAAGGDERRWRPPIRCSSCSCPSSRRPSRSSTTSACTSAR